MFDKAKFSVAKAFYQMIKIIDSILAFIQFHIQ